MPGSTRAEGVSALVYERNLAAQVRRGCAIAPRDSAVHVELRAANHGAMPCRMLRGV